MKVIKVGKGKFNFYHDLALHYLNEDEKKVLILARGKNTQMALHLAESLERENHCAISDIHISSDKLKLDYGVRDVVKLEIEVLRDGDGKE